MKFNQKNRSIIFFHTIRLASKALLILLLLILIGCKSVRQSSKATHILSFKKDNLIPWSIVGFDVKERNPQERLTMLKRLGYTHYAYGHRAKHLPTMLKEWQLAQEQGITIKAVWLYINLKKDQPGSLRDQTEAVFENLKKSGLKTQIWVGLEPSYFETLTATEAFDQSKGMIDYLAQRASSLGCKLALYNHGGWYGKPKNQLRLIESLPEHKLGMVLNFHHAHENLNTFSADLKDMMPYLWCVNLNGMRREGPKILSIGSGDLEREMLQQIIDQGYQGPFGILGHVIGGDPELILEQNYKGLQKLALELD